MSLKTLACLLLSLAVAAVVCQDASIDASGIDASLEATFDVETQLGGIGSQTTVRCSAGYNLILTLRINGDANQGAGREENMMGSDANLRDCACNAWTQSSGRFTKMLFNSNTWCNAVDGYTGRTDGGGNTARLAYDIQGLTASPSASPTENPIQAPTQTPNPTAPTNAPLNVQFTWHGTEFVNVTVQGRMLRDTILQACQERDLVPLCDHPSWCDSHGKLAHGQGLWHLSYPPQNIQHGIPVSQTTGAFFYTARGTGAIQNTGSTHRWAGHNDRDQWTYCTPR